MKRFGVGFLLCCLMTQAQGRGFDDWTVDPDSPCLGRYTPPTLPTLNTPGLHIEANESELNPNSYSTLQGDVLIRYGLHQLEADQATVITAPKNLRHVESLTATGAVRYRGPLAQMLAKQAFLDLSNHELTLEDAEYRIYTRPIRGTAKHIKVDAQDRIFLTQAEYTACPPGHCDWLFTADEVMIDIDNDYSTIKGGWLRINRVPVFYFPYLNVALDRSRKSGLLFPYFANSSQSGMITGIPYYFNLAPNYDLMLTPRWYQQRGLSMTSHVRYLTEKSSGHFEWFILPQDRKYHTFRTDKWAYHPSITTDTDPRLTELKGSNRQFVHWIHQSDISSHLRLNANIDWVADQNYFVDFFESLEKQSTDKVTQGLQVTYQDSNTNAVLLFQNNQALHSFNGPPRTEIYRLLPQLSASSTLPTPHQWLALTWQADAAHFTSKRDQLTGDIATKGLRAHARPTFGVPIKAPGWFFIPSVGLDYTKYVLSLGTQASAQGFPAEPARSIPVHTVDAGLIFDNYFQWGKRPMVQTLEPRLYYVYIPYHEQDTLPVFDTGPVYFSQSLLFRDNRFSGVDRLGDAHQLTYGLTTRLLSPFSGKEVFNASLGQIIYFNERRVSVCNQILDPGCNIVENPQYQDRLSGLVAELSWHINSRLKISGNSEWIPQQDWISKISANAAYRGSDRKVLNLGHQYIRSDPSRRAEGVYTGLRQTYVSAYWPLIRHWAVLGRAHYNHLEDYMINTQVGVEYDSCCFAFQLLANQTHAPENETTVYSPGLFGLAKYEHAFYFQVMFKGLSNLMFQKTEIHLKEDIDGYVPFAERESSENSL